MRKAEAEGGVEPHIGQRPFDTLVAVVKSVDRERLGKDAGGAPDILQLRSTPLASRIKVLGIRGGEFKS